MAIQVIQPGQRMTRKLRKPHHPTGGVMKPFGLYPTSISLVMPGETLKRGSIKMRSYSQPIKDRLAGWWYETWLVYVKLTDIDPDLGQMFVDDNYSTAGLTASADAPRYYTKSGQIDWVRLCVEKIHADYFLDDGETPRTIDGVRQVKVNNTNWMESAVFVGSEPALTTTGEHDMYENFTAYQMMRQMHMAEMGYEEYLKQFGVQSIKTEEGHPEILRYVRDWVYPVNSVEPTTGVPSSAVVASVNAEHQKDIYFKEPGFLVTVSTVRPKMFEGRQAATYVGELFGFSDWFPIMRAGDPTGGIKEVPSTSPVFTGNSGDAGRPLYVDTRDLLTHGEQFINSVTDLPTYSGFDHSAAATDQEIRGEYASEADIDALFEGADPEDKFFHFDGIVSHQILGVTQDRT